MTVCMPTVLYGLQPVPAANERGAVEVDFTNAPISWCVDFVRTKREDCNRVCVWCSKICHAVGAKMDVDGITKQKIDRQCMIVLEQYLFVVFVYDCLFK